MLTFYKTQKSMTRIIFTFLVAFMLSIMTGINASGQNIEKYKAAAERGDANAQYELARCYHRGEGVEIDKDLACYWYFEAAMQGHVKAQCWAGLCAYGGVGMAKDYDIARYFLKQAIANGDPETKELAESGLAAMEYEIYSLEHPIEEDADSDDYFAEIITLYFNEIQDETEGSLNGHEWVDLGLPSGTKWATCNVGADNYNELGDYFAFGETVTKNIFSVATHAYSTHEDGVDVDYTRRKLPYSISGSKYDAAFVNWGKGWRLPTKAEFIELFTECHVNRVGDMIKVIGPNGNYIYLNMGGYRFKDRRFFLNEYCVYWTSTNVSNNPKSCSFDEKSTDSINISSYCGALVRAVTD